jgi:two-component system cell cycle sensor histidine kinase/response regulator CckA
MLTFSRGRRGEARLLSLPQLVGEAAKLLRPALPSTIELRTELAAQVSAVRADPVQVEQVLLNLAINARDAMAAAGLIALAVREARPRGARCAPRAARSSRAASSSSRCTTPAAASRPTWSTACSSRSSPPRTWARAAAWARDGPRHRPRARRPHPGRHRGGLGACFRIALPAARGASAAVAAELARRQGKRALCGSVLVVDDEDMVLELMGDLLSGWGSRSR